MSKKKSKKRKASDEGATSHDETRTAQKGRKGAFIWGAASAVAVMLAAPLLRPAAVGAVKAGLRLGRQAQKFGSSLEEEFKT